MNKQEFTKLAIRKGYEISSELYNSIEKMYMSDNEYHKNNNRNGEYETKEDFVKRVFGGKVNSEKTILKKLIAEVIKENRFFLIYEDDSVLKEYDEKIEDFYTSISKM